ncbi:hypothetical protein J4E86_010784 [Alternaria arbusti]|uniref:uncharacterized protein n=1 Tax=Alternaria arbusti TaxID=232088 RepID=UPI00221FDE9E|nr:uncharacterized protein J4E86_010784 [Alternaria arbusti]KAI4940584.1 hypothetical protein J4E86_010784 [Alternaria arbusti]
MSPAITQVTDPTVDAHVLTSRSEEVEKLLDQVQDLIIPFIRSADNHNSPNDLLTGHSNGVNKKGLRKALVEQHDPRELQRLMALSFPTAGLLEEGFLEEVEKVLRYSVNTWDAGFMSKLYGSTDAPGLAAELVLASLNTQVHTFQVSPALAVIEKFTARALANLFGLNGAFAGGVTTSGGSGSNATAMLVARHTLFPETKQLGNSAGGLRLAAFTSANGHYSIEKAGLMLGLGTSSVFAVPADPATRSMDPAALRSCVENAISEGFTPFFLNATAGTTVFGAYDNLRPLHAVCKDFGMWLHVDASLGGPAVFSAKHKYKLDGSHLANSITINPHKMMGVPATCSFVLSADIRQFHTSNTLPASYLFHSADSSEEVFDLADLTMQCGRRGDALKMYLSWMYHGYEGYAKQVDAVFSTAAYLAKLVEDHPNLVLISPNPPPCCQVCFYYAEGGRLSEDAGRNEEVTKQIAAQLVHRGFMVDYAGGDTRGAFLRPVVSRGTGIQKVEELIEVVEQIGSTVWGSNVETFMEYSTGSDVSP